MEFTGRWRIVSSPDFDAAYLAEETEPYVQLWQEGNSVTGEYHVGYQSGSLDGKLRKDQQVVFSFEGMDEMEEVHGRGTAALAGDTLTLVLEYHFGDTYTFAGVRESAEAERTG
jgi:hypothetical protein